MSKAMRTATSKATSKAKKRTKKQSKKPDLELRLPPWLKAMPWDPDDLKHNVIHLLSTHDEARPCLKTKAVARAHAAVVAAIDQVRAGALRGTRGARRVDALDTRLMEAIAAAYEATLVTCHHCYGRLTREEFQQAAERRIREKKPTGCLTCAVWERRPFELQVSWKQARAFLAVIDAHTDAALAAVPNRVMVDVLEGRDRRRPVLERGEAPQGRWSPARVHVARRAVGQGEGQKSPAIHRPDGRRGVAQGSAHAIVDGGLSRQSPRSTRTTSSTSVIVCALTTPNM
jgi:hypothetical protein